MVKPRGSTSGPSSYSSRKKADDEEGNGDTNSKWDSDNDVDNNEENDDAMEMDDDDDDDEVDSDEEFIPPEDLMKSLPRRRKIIPRAKRIGGGDLAKTPINYKLKFEQLGGLEEQIRIINESIIFRHQNAEALQRSGLKHTIGGILLEGPPGTGKTICAHTIAAELSRRTNKYYSFYTHNAVESFSKWMGETEKSIRKLFQCAAENKPSIIFFDEFDSLCPRRDVGEKGSGGGGGHGQSHTTIVGTLLAEFNNIQDNDIIIIATTNLKSSIDPAMLRNGRFDFSIHFPLPNEAQRRSILQIKMGNYTVTEPVFDFLSKQTEGFSGSSLTFLCDEAKLNAFKRQKLLHTKSKNKNSNSNSNNSNSPKQKGNKGFTLQHVDKEDFLLVFKTVQIPKSIEHKHQYLPPATQVDPLFSEVSDFLVNKLRPYVFGEKDRETMIAVENSVFDDDDDADPSRTQTEPGAGAGASSSSSSRLVCSCYTNCFLVWSSDSNVVFHEKILPRILHLLSQPVFKISREVLDNVKNEKFHSSSLQAFHSIVAEAKGCGKPCILLVENLDQLLASTSSSSSSSSSCQEQDNENLLAPDSIVRELSYLGNNLVFVLASASKGSSKLPLGVQQLFKPFHHDKALELPVPSSKAILESFEHLHTFYVEPALAKLTVSSTKWKGKKSQQQPHFHPLTAKSFTSEIQRLTRSNSNTSKFSFQQASTLRSEICTVCRTSDDPSDLTQNILTLLQNQQIHEK